MRAASKVESAASEASSGLIRVAFSFRLYNEGPASATDLIVVAKPVPGLDYRAIPLWQQLATPAGVRLSYEQPFHPGQMIELPPAGIELPFVPRMARQTGRSGDVDLAFQLYANDQAPQQIGFHCDADDIRPEKEWTALPEPLSITRYR
jgi:hypothetical protein